MDRYDQYDSGASAQSWEYNNHGPPQNPASWWGHCHAWAGAACWETQPDASRILGGITFRVRDRKGVLIEAYHNCASGWYYDFIESKPSPGLLWRWLRFEIAGWNPMHGRPVPFVGELYYGPDEVWNYTVYKYLVDYTWNGSSYDGTIKIYYTLDGDPSYADDTTRWYTTKTYTFTGVSVSDGQPVDSGSYSGSGPYHRPDVLWRPIFPGRWTYYAVNPYLDDDHVGRICSTRKRLAIMKKEGANDTNLYYYNTLEEGRLDILERHRAQPRAMRKGSVGYTRWKRCNRHDGDRGNGTRPALRA